MAGAIVLGMAAWLFVRTKRTIHASLHHHHLVSVGVIAALSVRQAERRFKGWGEIARRAPYISSTVLTVVGLLMAAQGLRTVLH